MFRVIPVLFLIGGVLCSEDDLLTLQLSVGAVHGRVVNTPSGVVGYAFQGIPYAEPPTGIRRFAVPQPIAPWNNVLETTAYQKDCIWNTSLSSLPFPYEKLSEDCLYLNVFTSKKCLTDKNCSVVFYVHGGSWVSEGPSLYKAETLVENFLAEDRNVILVNFAYRLGFLGLINIAPTLDGLSTEKNLALHDQLTALKFTKREVAKFGGDPNKITLLGHSSGGDNAYSLYLSPLTADLISQVVIMSGANVEQELVRDQNTKVSQEIAQLADCADAQTDYSNHQTVEWVLQCLRKLPAERIVDLQRVAEDGGSLIWKSALDMGSPNAIFDRPTSELIKNKRPIPTLTGTTSKEFPPTMFGMINEGGVNMKRLQEFCYLAVQITRATNFQEGFMKCLMRYSNPLLAGTLFNDVFFFTSTYNSAVSSHAVEAPIYLYQFEYTDIGGAYYVKPNFTMPKAWTPAHGQELSYLLGLYQGPHAPKDDRIQKEWSQFFVNFVNTGNPGFGAQPFLPAAANYLTITFDSNGQMTPKINDGFHSEVVQFWNGMKA